MAFTANFLTELSKEQFKGNIVLQIGSDYFSQYPVDSGLVVDPDRIGLILKANVNGVKLDLRKANNPIGTLGFSLLDDPNSPIVTTYIMSKDNMLHGEKVTLHFGFITGSFDFADYAPLAVTYINQSQKDDNSWSFNSKEAPSLLKKELLRTVSTLDGAITAIQTTLNLQDTSSFPASGRVKIDDEIINYTTKDDGLNELQGLTRSDLNSTASNHDDESQVFNVTEKKAHAIDIALDVILNDLGIDPAVVDQTSFTDIRDNQLAGETDFTLYFFDELDGLKWLEDKIFIATNTRLLSDAGKLKLVILDQVPTTEDAQITEEHTLFNPKFSINSDKIINKVQVNWFYSVGLGKYTRTYFTEDAESISIYDERKTYILNLDGVRDEAQAIDRASRILARLSTPQASITARTHFNRAIIDVADAVNLVHRYLPQRGGALDFNDNVEAIGKAYKNLHNFAECSFNLEFSSYTSVRIGLISPSPFISNIVNQKTFDVPDGSLYAAGYKLRLFNTLTSSFLPDPINTIDSVVGNTITMVDDWATPLVTTIKPYFPTYANSSGGQRAKYAYTAPDTNVFPSDNSKAYQILI